MFKPLLLALIATVGLAACSTPTNRVDLIPLQSDLRRTANVSTVMVRTVSLPTYAAADEVAVESLDGLITTEGGILWADQPERAATLAITRHLNMILSSAVVGPDPWPFASLPDVAVEVRVEEIIAGSDGVFRLRGQYFVGGDGINYRNSVNRFSHVAVLADASAKSVAAAQSQVLLELSEEIAGTLSR